MKTYQIYYSSDALPKSWDYIVQHDIFLQSKYLNALQEGAPSNIELFYIGVFENDNLVGVAIVQRVRLYLKDMFRKTQVSCLKEFLQNLVSKVLKGNILVVGNLTHTGQHGLYFDEKRISYTAYLNQVFSAINELKKDIKSRQGKTIRLILVKDFFEQDTKYNHKLNFDKQDLHKIVVQPNMIMEVRSNWLSTDNYISDLTKKYRSRYKRAQKKLGTIRCEELDTPAVKAYEHKLHKLYLNVSNNAKFNTFILPENHFFIMKQKLGEDFKVFGYFLEDILVGFYTLILNRKQLETYFLGYDKAHQYVNQLYLNMLYDMLKFGVDYQFASIVYARTAMAIKSSVGAKPKPMVMYMKHTNSFWNRLLKLVFRFMNPKQNWEERHPFK
ncbi:GNAT family N-acetyltransferase [Tamlana sp. 2201CG12-4]|uniref:GNAT family N-acetyltransferase n=1 Tax=Tamlana sp. 2201CG12-4 TaxID=3112582 RepID=UPI002DC03A6B|nr:GNAT family N-acetyltransferase [Tamlana sp. 2201CG12-4]MEC3906264.1 GNAT family N-acetyltransferase [Tamlana sp. 2201CG12-4]